MATASGAEAERANDAGAAVWEALGYRIVFHRTLATVIAALAASTQLEARGILVTAIRPPSVPEGTARLRCSFTASHTEDDVALLAVAIRELGLVAR